MTLNKKDNIMVEAVLHTYSEIELNIYDYIRGEYFLLFGDNYHGTGLKFDPFSEKF